LEALFGLLLCLTVSPIGLLYGIVMLCKFPEKTRQWLPFIVYSLGILAYSYNPIVEDDLMRYFYKAQEYAGLPLDRVFYDASGVNQYDVLTWIYATWSWLIGQIGAVHLLPMVSVMTIYGIAFYITADFAKAFKGEKYIPFVVLFQICMLPLPAIISNVRNVWAFSLVILAAYLDLIRRKRNILVLLLYILPGFIHSSAFLLLFLRFLCRVGSKIIVPLFAGSLVLPQIIDFLYEHASGISAFGTVGLFINLSILRLYWYIHDNGETEWAQQVANSLFQRINRTVMIAFAVLTCLLILLWIKKSVEEKYRPFLNYMMMLNIGIIAFTWFTAPHFWRLSAASFIGVGIALFPILTNHSTNKPAVVKLAKISLPFYMIAGVLVQFWPIQYIIHPSEWVTEAITTNIFTILFDVLKGIL